MVGQKYRTWHRWRFKYSNHTQKHVPKQNTLIFIIGFQECLSLASRTVLWDCANGIFSFSHFLSRNSLEFHWKGTEIKKNSFQYPVPSILIYLVILDVNQIIRDIPFQLLVIVVTVLRVSVTFQLLLSHLICPIFLQSGVWILENFWCLHQPF